MKNKKNNSKFLTRYFNSIEQIDNLVKKTSSEKNKILDEYYWFTKLPSNLSKYTPKVYSYNETQESSYILMDYVPWSNIYTFLENNSSLKNYINILDTLFNVLLDFKNTEFKKNNEKFSEFIYLTKTHDRIKNIKEEELIDLEKEIIFNSKKIKPFFQIKQKVLNLIEEKLLNSEITSVVHGDFFFGNILFDEKENKIKLVDPRGRFSYYRDIIGDIRYDLAKLSHSVIGKYDWIVNNNFEFIEDKNNFSLKENTFLDEKQNKEIMNHFKKNMIEKFNISFDNIRLIEGLLFLTMIPLHKESLIHQKIFYLKSLEIFNELIEKGDEWE
ncbi:phosphotransferase [Mesomycoplasma molare]|uniref:Aminoglycoside phosphotransferase family protein n=1 Tax=Mesomycoplasma molare TaxID=171288 RepID=A0ABY5TV33_9BACT|nr:phosphotransferase [Mesomycoplasma molare]UWD34199.1 aminoglycoside phosphotransferase family protein [Mesomycoplasma molare]